MATLSESASWTPGIYQLETTDPVLGGPDGIDNLQAKQLADRTVYLKQSIDALGSGATPAGKATVLATTRSLAITGDASWSVSFNGSANATAALTLANSGVTAGSYAKVTVNAKGLVTAGATLTAADLPSLDWSKIASGKPSTLGGYGITDAQPLDVDLTALAALTTVGFYVNTGVGTVAARGIAAGAGVSVSNSDGVAGNPQISLNTSGVSAGSYAKVTVDVYGRVTAGAALTAADVPALDWSKITSGKPTTLSGYGISTASQAQAEAGTDNALPVTALRVFQAIAKVVVQATEAIAGIASIASQAQTNAGTDDNTIVTPRKLRAGFAISLAANGYLTFPSWLGGLIIQWGAAPSAANATSAATFPLTFPNQCYQVLASGYNVNQVQAYAVVNSWNTVGFSWCGYNANAGSAPVLSQTVNGVQAQFIAIGR